ncbi:MAG: glycosyltransferase family 4 protein [Anaerolineae bacterium]
MQQYTADLANGRAADQTAHVDVFTVCSAPQDRFSANVRIHAVADVRGTGVKSGNLNPVAIFKFYRTIRHAQPDVVHFTTPHLWNPVLLALLRQAGIPTVHTIHDLDPHSGTSYGRILYAWNASIKRLASHILVHGQIYRTRLIQQGLAAERVSYAPLLHLFVNYVAEQGLREQFARRLGPQDYERFVLFFARLEAYKGLGVLIEAMRQIEPSGIRAVVAGKGDLQALASSPLPSNVEVRNRLILDDEAIELFKRCSVVVLPYLDATQSALIAAAYFFGKPVIVTRTGALPEYVVDGDTGWVIGPQCTETLAKTILNALNAPDQLVRMGEQAREWYLAQRRLERRTLRLMYDYVLNRIPNSDLAAEKV